MFLHLLNFLTNAGTPQQGYWCILGMTRVYYPVFLTLGSMWVGWLWLLYHVGMTLKDTVDSKGSIACQNHVPGKEMEEKERDTTWGIGKLDSSHLLLLPPSSWAAVNTGLFLQVHICVRLPSTCLSGFIWKYLRWCREPFGSVKQQDGSEPCMVGDLSWHSGIFHIQGWERHLAAEVKERAQWGTNLADERYWADILGQLQDN